MRGPEYNREYLTNKVAMMRIKGMSTYKIIEFLKNDIGMGQTTAYEILKDAQKVFIEIQKQKLEGAFEEALSQLEELYDSTSDKKLRLGIIQEISKMKGLYAAQKIEHTGKIEITGIDVVDAVIQKEEEKKDEPTKD